ncbi:rhamnogalacturonan acetylesterase [Sphingobium sp. PAMC28499]|uniref:rhamnogalacturonan acetylesterase n=1 Tax=Sphingobium sp. PAMC28499 TaxID=2565554 RepID=UPI00109DABC8|nr:rhamnogalacturonan acetylesterase [Sphingobium sp. PAMC28499]QCB40506.1 rhamnogalacturonan acetylesterase [Sphingobium sp. PAMC28499]
MRIATKAAAALALLATPLPALATQPGDTILIASDSTAANYKKGNYPQTGWGMMLGCGLSPQVRVSNHAMGGRSTRTFIEEGRWTKLMSELMPGDTVLIQFGHNDAYRAKPQRWAPAQTDYRNNLLRFIWDVRGAGGTPVLVTPVTRHSFGADGKAKADFAEYSAVMRELAASAHVPIIDLEALSRAWVDRAGPDKAKTYFLHYKAEDKMPGFPKGIDDDTHFSELGARNVADLVAGGLKALNLPISAKVLASRPALNRTMPLGRTECQ